jgi:hypothetical protein
LDENDYTIEWSSCVEEVNYDVYTYFQVKIKNQEVINKQLKGIPYFAFELDTLESKLPSPNDYCLRYILETEIRKN